MPLTVTNSTGPRPRSRACRPATLRRLAAAAMLVGALARASGELAAQPSASTLLPRPASLERSPEAAPFVLRSPVRVVVPTGHVRLREIGEWLATIVRARTGFVVTVTTRPPGSEDARGDGAITLDTAGFEAGPSAGPAVASEAYTLDVRASGVTIHGASAAAVLWGVQSLRQLLPPGFEEVSGGRPATWAIDAVQLHDAPRFAWRGSMLDVARHFLPVAEVKRHIDLLSRYKLNVLHWHLTDDQGWRLAIARYPRLTRIGGWRTEPSGERTGGFYSAAEVRDVVEHARRRGVMIVPEIEMPGHASAALASYPQFGCTGAAVAVPASWGVFADVFCAGHEETFTFLQGVLDEVVALFPAPYVHVGGDEVPKDRWRACVRCQALMRREGLGDEEALQGWFLQRIAAHLAARGRTMIAWDEALAGGVPPGGMVQSWRDSAFTREAASRGHRTIASPNEWMYLNRSPGELTLADVYRFDPVPAGLDSAARARVVGGEATFWSEHITSGTNLDLMALPRLLAVAEVLWGSGARDLGDLQRRIARDHGPRLEAMGHAVGPADRPLPALHVAYDTMARTARLRLTDAIAGTSVRLTTDGSRPTLRARAIGDGEALGGGTALRLQAFVRHGRVREERQLLVRRHLAIGAPARLAPAPSATYPGTGAWTMTDGLLGSATHADGVWAGWWGPDAAVQVDLGASQAVGELSLRSLQDVRSWILLPARVEFSWSNDGEQWTAPVVVGHAVPATREGAVVHRFALRLPPSTRLRHVRAVVRNAGRLPAGYPGAGEPSWLFADELVVSAPAPAVRR